MPVMARAGGSDGKQHTSENVLSAHKSLELVISATTLASRGDVTVTALP